MLGLLGPTRSLGTSDVRFGILATRIPRDRIDSGDYTHTCTRAIATLGNFGR